MCGIVGFTGKEQAAPILLEGLSKLEYRGYDSAGIAVRDGDRDVDIVKAKGRLKILAEKTNDGKAVIGSCGIGHTRWATHGEPSENNAHPHRSDDGNIVAVHNGIIENYQELKEKLVRKGYTFYSDTDTEVAVKLIDYYYTKYEGTPVDAINHAMVRIRGSYALAVMFNEYPEEIYVARKDSPMILGVEDGESYIASDVPAILKYTRNVYYIAYNVLSAFYQPFWAAVLLAFLTMFLYLYGKEHGWKKNNFIRNMFGTWWRAFRSSSNFRRTFLLAFYTAMILLRTVLNREIWFDPLGKLLGGWGLYEDGEFTTESIENFMLFVPFSILLLWAFQKELLDESENIRFGKTVWEATKVVAVFSFLIEFTQLLFHLGTFQISDLTYNTLGGAVGGVIYYLGYSRKRKK